MAEQVELPGAGLSKENREKVNTRIWIVGEENGSLYNLVKNQGYQVRVFSNGSLLEEALSEEGLNCDLIVTDYPFEIDFFSKDVFAMPKPEAFSNFPIIVLGVENDTEQDRKYFESMGAIYVGHSENEDSLLSKITNLTRKYKSKKQ
jgi:DNA-binding response OmpR family regulator